MKKIALFASGSGSNAENIIKYALATSSFEVVKIYCNNPQAGIILRAFPLNVPVEVFSKKKFFESEYILEDLKSKKIDAVILAGFLWLIPPYLIKEYGNRMLNIHPALLPKFGGKGMYGMNVHNAVKESHESKTGITIHKVNNEYDKGDIVFQAECLVCDEDNPETIAQKVHALEYEFFPKIIDKFLNEM